MKSIKISIPGSKSSILGNPTCLGNKMYSIVETNVILEIDSKQILKKDEKMIIVDLREND